MPRLDAFARARATTYTQARSTSSWTLPSHASLFTGLLPSEHGATHVRRRGEEATGSSPATALRADVTTLAELLRAEGYATAAHAANVAYLQRAYGLHRGFDVYEVRDAARTLRRFSLAQFLGLHPEIGALRYRDARSIADDALDWLDARPADRPFFLFLNFMEAHLPYYPPTRYAEALRPVRLLDPLRPRSVEELLVQYERSLRYVDDELARVLERLERDGALDDTVVVVTSDHGEAFGEHDFWFHGRTLYEEMIRVPLYVKPAGPRPPGRERVDAPVTGADVFAIALDALGLGHRLEEVAPAAAARARGEAWGPLGAWYRSDKHDPARNPVPIDRDLLAWLDGTVKTIAASTGAIERYDLATDPGERSPLPATDAEVAAAVARAADWWRAHPPPVDGALEIDEDALRRLRDLGYID